MRSWPVAGLWVLAVACAEDTGLTDIADNVPFPVTDSMMVPTDGTPNIASSSDSATTADSVPLNPNYTDDVLPLLQMTCLGCHRPGGSQPNRPWGTYDEATKDPCFMSTKSCDQLIVENAVYTSNMPLVGAPWTPQEKNIVLQWYRNGSPE